MSSSAGAAALLENRKFIKFSTTDRPFKKRLRDGVDFLKTSSENLVLKFFWLDNGDMVWSVLKENFNELKSLEKSSAFGKSKKKIFDSDEWKDLTYMMDEMLRNRQTEISRGWKNSQILDICSQCLLKDNNAFVRVQGYRWLLLYIDGIARNGMSDGPHVTLFQNSIDYSPYAGVDTVIPVLPSDSIECWKRLEGVSADEPITLLKFLFDHTLVTSSSTESGGNASTTESVGRFRIWADLIMRYVVTLFYPEVCKKVGLKRKDDLNGFFHHCPGSFQRLFARWLQKLRPLPEYMEQLWENDAYSFVVMDTLTQRFSYRDAELVQDALKTYGDWCSGVEGSSLSGTRIVQIRKSAINNVLLLLFQPNNNSFDEEQYKDIIVNATNLLEKLSKMALSEETYKLLRQTVISIISDYYASSSVTSSAVLTKTSSRILEAAFQIWINGIFLPKGANTAVWNELSSAIKTWISSSSSFDHNDIAIQSIYCWRENLMSICRDIMKKLVPDISFSHINRKAEYSTGNSIFSQTSAFSSEVTVQLSNTQESILVLDRILHLIPPPDVTSMPEKIHLGILDAMKNVINLWIQTAVILTTSSSKKSSSKSPLSNISPSTLMAFFGEWFLPSCRLSEEASKQAAQVAALDILCMTCTVRTDATLLPIHAAQLCHIVHSGLRSKVPKISTALYRRGVQIFTSDVIGINILIPAFIQSIPETLRTTSLTQSDLKCIVNVLATISAFTARYPSIKMTTWEDHVSCILKSEKNVRTIEALKRFGDSKQLLVQSTKGVRISIGKVLRRIVETPLKGTTLKQKCIWGIYNIVIVELSASDEPHSQMTSAVTGWVSTLCEQIKNSELKISQTSLNALSSLTNQFSRLLKCDKKIVTNIILSLASFVSELIEAEVLVEKKNDSLKGTCIKITSAFDTLRAWLMLDCTITLADPKVRQAVFSATEASLFGNLPRNADFSSSNPAILRGLALRQALENRGDSEQLEILNEIAYASEGLLLHLLHHFNEVPSSKFDSLNGTEDEKHEDEFSFIYKDSMIISVIGKLDTDAARIVLRDVSGTYVWDAKYLKSAILRRHRRRSSTQRRTSVAAQVMQQRKVAAVPVISETSTPLNDTPVTVKLVESDKRIITSNESLKKKSFHNKSSSSSSSSSRFPKGIGGILQMKPDQPGVGSLDGETSLLDLFINSVSLKFPDISQLFENTDKTLLGGNYTLQKYTEASKREIDSLKTDGLSLWNRILHDKEVFDSFKSFILNSHRLPTNKVETATVYLEFCEGVRHFISCETNDDRKAQASVLYWKFISPEAVRTLEVPSGIKSSIAEGLQENVDSALFVKAMSHIEVNLIDAYITEYFKSENSNLPTQAAIFRDYYETEILANAYRYYTSSSKRNNTGDASSEFFEPCEAKTSTDRVNTMDYCRLLLSHLGLFPLTRNSNDIRLLERDVKFLRSLKNLDKSPSLETMKIGVIYVGPGQFRQSDILRNEAGSIDYNEFLTGLGWRVKLESHQGFTGGLDCNPKSLSNGQSTMYYSDSMAEIVFHTVTDMPTKVNDPQQIDKKRHVGNDFVHIVWSDNSRDYDPTTISSSFNDVQIVVQPLRRSHPTMYRIQIYSKPDVPFFGPLMTGTVVAKANLPALVRQTAIQANRYCRSKTAVYRPPYPTRRILIEEIAQRYSVPYNDATMLKSLLQPKNESLPPSNVNNSNTL